MLSDSILNGTTGLLVFTTTDNANVTATTPTISLLHSQPALTIFLLCLYAIIFLVGIFGNVMVLYVVIRYQAMQTITNKFIACLSTSDLLLCLFAIPFTPMNALMPSWIFGGGMCKLVPVAMSVSVFISTWTCVAIALDRYFAIVHPHVPRMNSNFQALVITVIWIFSAATSLPIAIFTSQEMDANGEKSCRENWPNSESLLAYTCNILVLQVVLPVLVISYCYISVSVQLYKQAEVRLGTGAEARIRMNARRNKRINKMLIAMVVIFVSCWLPLDLYHFFNIELPEDYQLFIFLITHVIAMSSVMYNPILYGWMNENFNTHFHKALPCLKKLSLRKRSQSYSCSRVTMETTYKTSRRPSTEITTNVSGGRDDIVLSNLAYSSSGHQLTNNELQPFLVNSNQHTSNGMSAGLPPPGDDEMPIQLHTAQEHCNY